MAEDTHNMSMHESSSMKSQAELDTFFAHIDLLRAENEAKGKALLRKWATPDIQARLDSSEKRTQEAVDLEDARLFQPQPLYLGVGAAIPHDFLASEASSGTRALRKKFFPATTLKASKARDAEEKTASAKRGLNHDSSDGDEGRTALGRTKKTKIHKAYVPARDAQREQAAANLLPEHRTSVVEATQLSLPQRDQSRIEGDHEGSRPDALQDLQSTTSIMDTGAMSKKKRKKSKRKTGLTEQEIHTSKMTVASHEVETVANIEHDLTVSSLHGSNVEVAQVDIISENEPTNTEISTSTQISKEQKKRDKKLRKEERRRQRRQDSSAEVGVSLIT